MKKTFLGYLAELIIVILGVSVAFWLNEVSSDRKEERIRLTYLSEIRSDVRLDIRKLNFVLEENTQKIKKTQETVPLLSDPDVNKEAILQQALEIGSYSFFKSKDFTYQSMIASGDFKLLKNSDIKRKLIALHSQYDIVDNLQKNYIQALDDNYFPFLVENFDYTTFQPSNLNFHKSMLLRNFFMFSLNDRSGHIVGYKRAIKIANELDSLISTEIERFD